MVSVSEVSGVALVRCILSSKLNATGAATLTIPEPQTHSHTLIHQCIYIYIHTRKHIYIYINIYTRKHIYIYIYIYTLIHIHANKEESRIAVSKLANGSRRGPHPDRVMTTLMVHMAGHGSTPRPRYRRR